VIVAIVEMVVAVAVVETKVVVTVVVVVVAVDKVLNLTMPMSSQR